MCKYFIIFNSKKLKREIDTEKSVHNTARTPVAGGGGAYVMGVGSLDHYTKDSNTAEILFGVNHPFT